MENMDYMVCPSRFVTAHDVDDELLGGSEVYLNPSSNVLTAAASSNTRLREAVSPAEKAHRTPRAQNHFYTEHPKCVSQRGTPSVQVAFTGPPCTATVGRPELKFKFDDRRI